MHAHMHTEKKESMQEARTFAYFPGGIVSLRYIDKSVMIKDILEPLVCDRFRCDARYREGHLRIVNALPGREVLGLHSPEMKEVAKGLAREKGEGLIMEFENAAPAMLCYEEIAVWGFMINFVKVSTEQRFEMLGKYVPAMDNWAVCDSYVAHAKWMKKVQPDVLLNFVDKWFSSHREFEVRFAVIVSMCYLLDSRLDDVFARLDAIDFGSIESKYQFVGKRGKSADMKIQSGIVLGPKPYYVRMGVAWLLATALAKYPDRTRTYIRDCRLPKDVLKLYVRKVRESFRTKNTLPF